MSIFTFYLETSSEKFLVWLNDYTKKIGGVNSTDYPYMGGGVYRIHYYEIYNVNHVNFSAKFRRPVISNHKPAMGEILHIYDPEEDVTYTYWTWDFDDVIGLSWLDVEKGIRVTIKHDDAKWIIPPVFQLLAAIKADYPSASEEINRYIVEKADWWEFISPYSLENPLAMTYIIAEQARDEVIKNKSVEPAPLPVADAKDESGLPQNFEDKTGWDAVLIQMWNDGHTRDEIANRVKVSPARVTNRITELRNKFGEKTIPYDKERKKLLIKKS